MDFEELIENLRHFGMGLIDSEKYIRIKFFDKYLNIKFMLDAVSSNRYISLTPHVFFCSYFLTLKNFDRFADRPNDRSPNYSVKSDTVPSQVKYKSRLQNFEY
ncbi:hypothetical protein BpHYR1_039785 [Brachionus plicatilis]|uniref:Uncharacterized protein n=1 Tax=Brachionus plicatilis TaxID=10195 RepID=A0A3M7Q6N0_BRAPC|nr:hypothetical protein BpHYR1_039785 [Brachionus plicatilis]